MRFNAPARMPVVQNEVREACLIELIQRDLSARRLIGGAATAACYRLVARSLDSPAARALGAVAADAIALGITLRLVLLKTSATPLLAGGVQGPLVAAASRVISDPRFLDAHEQLVLSSRTAWIGDCMRRDPGKRDAYECYCEDCEATAGWAARSFERLWTAALPVDLGAAVRTPLGAPAHEIIDASLIAASEPPSDAVTVRH
jgi:hypothetical protein